MYVVGKIKEILKIVIAESCCCKFNFSLHCDVNGNHLVDPFQTHIFCVLNERAHRKSNKLFFTLFI